MKRYKLLLGERIWDINYLQKKVNDCDKFQYHNEYIYAQEIKTGTWYKCDIYYDGEDEPTWDRLRPWELEAILIPEKEPIETDSSLIEFDDLCDNEIEQMNRSYIDDDLYNNSNDFIGGFTC